MFAFISEDSACCFLNMYMSRKLTGALLLWAEWRVLVRVLVHYRESRTATTLALTCLYGRKSTMRVSKSLNKLCLNEANDAKCDRIWCASTRLQAAPGFHAVATHTLAWVQSLFSPENVV